MLTHSRTSLPRFIHLVVVLTVTLQVSALASAAAPKAALGDAEVRAFMERGVPVMPQVVSLVGAATVPEADSGAFLEAIERLASQRSRIDAVIPRLSKRWSAVLADGRDGAKGGKRLLRRIDAHAPLRSAVVGASLRRAGDTPLGGPLAGGINLGPTFGLLGKLLAGDIVVALARGELPEASEAAVRMLRYGALIADSARTLDELSSGLRITRDALGGMLMLPVDDSRTEGRGTAKDMRAVRRILGEYSAELKRVRKTFDTSKSLKSLASYATASSSALWRYEAFKALRGVAWSGIGTARGQEAEALLRKIAESGSGPGDAKRAAAQTLLKLKASR
ncbi:MAG: hypothetical protein ACPGU1_05915 [Myxococcota bacterium]